jgi:hypothetical protein
MYQDRSISGDAYKMRAAADQYATGIEAGALGMAAPEWQGTTPTQMQRIPDSMEILGNAGGASVNNLSVTTTASSSIFNWNFGAEGDMPIYTVNDITNSRVYRITIMIGLSYNNNFICIERLM